MKNTKKSTYQFGTKSQHKAGTNVSRNAIRKMITSAVKRTGFAACVSIDTPDMKKLIKRAYQDGMITREEYNPQTGYVTYYRGNEPMMAYPKF